MSVGFRYILFTTRSPSVHLRVFLPGTSNPSLTLPCEKHGPRIWCHGRVLSTVAGEKITPNTENGEDGEPAWVDARPFREIPGPRGWPFIGVLRDYTKGPYSIDRFHHTQLELYKRYGKIYKQTIVGETAVHLFDPDYVKVIYQTEGKVPHVPPLQPGTQMYRKYRNMSLGLGNSNGDEWYRLRSAVQQMMMRPRAVSQYLPLVNQIADDFVDRMAGTREPISGQVPDFKNELLMWNLESSGMTCFETRLGCLEAERDPHPQRMVNANTAIFQHTTTMKFMLPWHNVLPTSTWRRLVEAEDYFFGHGQQLVDRTVEKVRQALDSGELEEGRYAFITYLMGRPEISYKDLSIIALSLFADGLSTTVPTLIGQLYCLAKNPLQQERLYEEIRQEAGTATSGQLTSDVINKMTYLKAAVKEGFRFFPVGPDVARIPQKDLVIGGYQIPAGTHVYMHNNLLLRLPEYFDYPDTYRPERWLRGQQDGNIHPYLLVPFSFGPRMCAGRRFAEQEMYVLITKILQRFRLEWPHDEDMGQRYVLLLTPDTPAKFRFVPRE